MAQTVQRGEAPLLLKRLSAPLAFDACGDCLERCINSAVGYYGRCGGCVTANVLSDHLESRQTRWPEFRFQRAR
jgi:hypothetical protein